MAGLLAFAQLIISIDYNIVYVALPEIGKDVGLDASLLQWVVSAYALAFGGFLIVGGRCCDIYGARRIFVAGLALYAVGSLAGGASTIPALLISGRVVQGIGGALLFPAVLTLLSTRFPDRALRNRAFALWGTAGGAGMVLGSLLGGVLTQAWGWQAVFYVNVPLALGTIALSRRLIPADPPVGRRRVDLTAAMVGTAGVSLVILAVTVASDTRSTLGISITLAGAGLLALIVFALLERRSRDPLIPPHLLKDRSLVTGMCVTAVYMASFGTVLYFLTLYFQELRGYSALETGAAFIPPMVGILAGSQLAGRLVVRYGVRNVMAVSMAVGLLGAAATVALLTANAAYISLVPGLVILGLGQGAGWTVMFAGATVTTAAQDQGVASGLASTTQQIGGATGLALLVALGNQIAHGSTELASVATLSGYRAALLGCCLGIGVTLLLSLRFPRPTVLQPH